MKRKATVGRKRTSLRNHIRDSEDDGSTINEFEVNSSSSEDGDSDSDFIVADHEPTSMLLPEEQQQLDYEAYS